MVTIAQNRLDQIFSNFNGKSIAIVGDIMLDRYFWGKVARISPEAPVPVVEVDSVSARLGGSANVANNVVSLTGNALMVGVIGNDEEGKHLRDLAKSQGLSEDCLVVDESRPTTTKTRVIGHGQHIVRIDSERKAPLNRDAEKRLLSALEARIREVDAVILEDYNKGVLTDTVIRRCIELARKHDKPVTVDPKFDNFFAYRNVTVFKPNRKEIEEALGTKISDLADLEEAGNSVRKKLKADHVLVTLGAKGMALFSNGPMKHVETVARNVVDVSGAGDTVIAALTMGIVAGAAVVEAAAIANIAAGVVCGEVGAVPVDMQKLIETAKDEMMNGRAQ